MYTLVTLEQVKAALHVLHTDDDSTLELFITAASNAVVNYLDTQAEAVLGLPGDSPPLPVPGEVTAAVILLTGQLYRDPDGNSGNPDRAFEDGYLPRPVVSLLYPLRDPAIA